MWCALHVTNGNEERTEVFLRRLIPKEIGARCFHFTRSCRKKYGGKWQMTQDKLFPGYVFIDTDRPEAVHRKVKQVPGLCLLFSDNTFVSVMEKEETGFLSLIADGEGKIGLSEIDIEDGKNVRYLSGPLTHAGHLVRRVDLHRRRAEVEAQFLGERCVLYLGIWIRGENNFYMKRNSVTGMYSF